MKIQIPEDHVIPRTKVRENLNNNQKEGVSTGERLVAGGLAGAISRTIIAPIDRTKILIQTKKLSVNFNRLKLGRIRNRDVLRG